MEPHRNRDIPRLTVVVLVVAIGAVDVLANSVAPEATRVPTKLAILFAFVLWARRGAGLSWAELGLDRARLPDGIRLGGLTALAIAAVILFSVGAPVTQSFFETRSIALDSTAQHLLMPIVIIPVGTALFEETLFRGVLLGVLLRTTSRGWAVAVSSVLFGLWHIPPALHDARGHGVGAAAGAVVGVVAFTTVAGALFALLRLRSGSLAAPFLAHAGTNVSAYLAALAVS